MNPTRKNFKLKKKTLFIFKKQIQSKSQIITSDPISVTATTPDTSIGFNA